MSGHQQHERINEMGEVVSRTAWFEKVQRNNQRVFRWLPFYTVTVEGNRGRFIEPVDCMKRRTPGTSETTIASKYGFKEVNEIQEFFWGRQAGLSDESYGQTDMTLHSLDWDWPK
jgi:hypothetical protein